MKNCIAGAIVCCLAMIGIAATSAPKSELTLESPNGENTITLRATNNVVGLYMRRGDQKEEVNIYVMDREGAVIGVRDGVNGSLAGALATNREHGGTLQLIGGHLNARKIASLSE